MLPERKIQNASRQIRQVTYLSIWMNIALTLAKCVVGFLAGSIAIVADGLHSLSDMLTDFVVLLGVRIGSKAPDRKHQYGHGRAETFAAAIIAAALVGLGCAMVYYAARDITKGRVAVVGAAGIVVTVISIVAKELLYRLTRKVGFQTHSAAVYANAWHHRSDALSSVAVLIGLVALRLGFAYGDQVAGAVVGLMIALVGLSVMGNCFQELTESAADAETIDHITRIIAAESRVHHWHNLRTRTVGREVFLDLHILVDPQLTITAAHEIAETLETTLHHQLPRPVNITVHIEPDTAELRK
jgi:cation diffusion facilitator family transporter